MAIGRKLQHCDVDSNDSSTARTRRVIIMQARAAAGRGQRSTRHRSRGCTNFWQGERGKIYTHTAQLKEEMVYLWRGEP